MKILQDKFPYGHFVYVYYSYLETFHTEPEDWLALFEHGAFREANYAVEKFVRDNSQKENASGK